MATEIPCETLRMCGETDRPFHEVFKYFAIERFLSRLTQFPSLRGTL